MKQYDRMVQSSMRPRLVASLVLSLLVWLDWSWSGTTVAGLPNPWIVMGALALNLVVTEFRPSLKRRAVAWFQRNLLNPLIRLLVRLGLPLGWVVLETTGHRSGQPRPVPVGHGLVGDTFWVIAEHGADAAYVRNLQVQPRVRVRLRQGWRVVWRTGTAQVLVDDDPYARQR